MNYVSFFSGALGLDLGLEKAGLVPLLYCENNKYCQQTIKINKPEIPLIDDIKKYHADDILNIVKSKNIDLVVGGPPCQAFSTAGARKSFEDKRGNIFLHFLDIATTIRPKYIVIENVRGLLSASYDPSGENKKGTALKHILEILSKSNYLISFNLYNAANYGVPQIRERIIIIATLAKNKVPYLQPTHSQGGEFNLPKWNNLDSAIKDLSDKRNQYCAKFPEKRLKYYKLLKSGQNWRNLPIELQKEALGKSYNLGGGKTGFLRRLDWDKPSPTLVTSPIMPATDLAHPDKDRPLSVAEYARIQQFPDNWIFAGKINEQYKQIGNAVPVGLGTALGYILIKHNKEEYIENFDKFPYSRYNFTNELNWEEKFQ